MEDKKLYLREWLQFRGKYQRDLVRDLKMDKSQLSKIVNNDFKRAPYPATLRKVADYLRISIEDLWRSPFDTAAKGRPSRTVEVVDLEDWLNDPFATVDGKPATPEFKSWLRATLDQMVKK
jgi:transcriptional regulator with XRE-family HTH domain